MCTSHGRGGIQFCRFKILRRNRPSSSRGREPAYKYQSRRARIGGSRACLGTRHDDCRSRESRDVMENRTRDRTGRQIRSGRRERATARATGTRRRGFSPRGRGTKAQRPGAFRIDGDRPRETREARQEGSRQKGLWNQFCRTPQRDAVGLKNFIRRLTN